MIGLLDGILTAVRAFGQLVAFGVVTALNALIAAVGALASGILSLLPALPALPGPPDHGWLAWIAYVYPMGAQLLVLGLFVGCWTGFLAIRAVLRWVRLL